MYLVLLKLDPQRPRTPQLMAAHRDWLQRGFDDGVFLLSGSLQPPPGGAVLAQGGTRAELQARVADDPLVAAAVAQAEIIEIQPHQADPRLACLLPAATPA